MELTKFGELGELFQQMRNRVELEGFDDQMDAGRLKENPTEYTDNEIESLIEKGRRLAAFSLSESVTDRYDKRLLEEVSETAMERAFMLWELDNRTPFVEVYRNEVIRLCGERKKSRGSDTMYFSYGRHVLHKAVAENAEYFGMEFSLQEDTAKSIVKETVEQAVYEIKSEGLELDASMVKARLDELLGERAEKLVQSSHENESEKAKSAPKKESVHKLLMTEEQKAIRERALSLTDPSELDGEMYESLVDYGVSMIVTRYSGLERHGMYEIAQQALSRAVMTFDKNIARERNARFGTHYTWQIMAWTFGMLILFIILVALAILYFQKIKNRGACRRADRDLQHAIGD